MEMTGSKWIPSNSQTKITLCVSRFMTPHGTATFDNHGTDALAVFTNVKTAHDVLIVKNWVERGQERMVLKTNV